MKKIVIILGAVLLTLNFNTSYAQKEKKTFEGTIVYELSYNGTNLEAAQIAQLPKEQSVIIKGNKSKIQMEQGGATITLLTDGDNKSMVMLLDVPMIGKKYAVRTSKEKLEEELAKNSPTVKMSEETKTIAGYVCKKADVVVKDEFGEETTTTIYFSNELGAKELNFNGIYREIDGLPFEYEEKTDEVTTKYAVKSLKKAKVKDTEFLIPSDYEEITPEQLQTLFGGGNQEE